MDITQIFYNVELDTDFIAEKKNEGWTEEDIKNDIKKHGLSSQFIADYEVSGVS